MRSIEENVNKDHGKQLEKEQSLQEVRHEPPQPVEPIEVKVPENKLGNKKNQEIPKEKINDKEKKEEQVKEETKIEPAENLMDKSPNNDLNKGNLVIKDQQGPVVEPILPKEEVSSEVKQSVNLLPKKEHIEEVRESIPFVQADLSLKVQKKDSSIIEEAKETIKEDPQKKNDEVDIEAIQKEDTELKEQEKEKNNEVKDGNQILIDTILKQNEVQKEIVEQQKQLIKVIQKQQENVKNKDLDKVNEEKLKAVKQIESIARKAIESISGKDKQNLEGVEQESVKNIPIHKVSANLNPDKKTLPENSEIFNQSHVEKDSNNLDKIGLIPLPIALAQINNKSSYFPKNEEKGNNTIFKDKEKEKDTSGTVMNQNGDKKLENEINKDAFLVKDNSLRRKREVNRDDSTINKMKELCEEIQKLTVTEKPIIKMLCNLSDEPYLVAEKNLGKSGNLRDGNLGDIVKH